MTERLQATIPAQPGWFVATFLSAARMKRKKDSLYLQPVIAWEIWRNGQAEYEGRCIPITLNGSRPLDHCCLLKSPEANSSTKAILSATTLN
jgi:hypothetical protein